MVPRGAVIIIFVGLPCKLARWLNAGRGEGRITLVELMMGRGRWLLLLSFVLVGACLDFPDWAEGVGAEGEGEGAAEGEGEGPAEGEGEGGGEGGGEGESEGPREGEGEGAEADRDGDLVPDGRDNCPDDPNQEQEDSDEDGLGDVCDPCPDRPGGPAPEVCNGLDDDCDGETDDGLDPIPADEVRGECAGNVKVCNGAAGYQAPGNNYSPVAEVCNGRDDDCDGETDENDLYPNCDCVLDINGTGLDLEFCTVVPAGGSATFWMGCREDLNGAGWSCQADEHVDADTPQHEVTFEQGFALLRTEVTEAQYRACVLAGHPGCVAADGCDWGSPNYGEAGAGQHPIVCVSWAMAVAFSEWIGGRLPSEAEWEYGARGPMESADDYSVFPWGDDEIDCDHAAYSGCPGDEVDVGSFSPVGDSPFGLADMSGSVWEWAQDCYHANYGGAPGDGRAWEGCGAGDRVARGGSWNVGGGYCRVALRYVPSPSSRYDSLGIRTAMSLH